MICLLMFCLYLCIEKLCIKLFINQFMLKKETLIERLGQLYQLGMEKMKKAMFVLSMSPQYI
jgi:hypothetical protein